MVNEKLPPHNTDAEHAVLGSLLIDPDAIVTIASDLHPEDFYDERARWTYEACLSLWDRNEAINQITVAEELARKRELEGVGGVAYLSQVVSVVPTSIHIEYYAQIVRRLAVMRRLISSAGQIAALGYEADPDVDAVLDKAESILFKLRHGEGPRNFVHIRQVLEQYFEGGGLVAPHQEGQLVSVMTGFTRLDELLGGLQRSDMVILAARPSLGKSSLALNIARNAAMKQGAHIAVFSLEMGKEQLVQRLLASEAGVDSNRLRLGTCTAEEERRIFDASGALAEAPIYVDDSPLLRMVEMRSKARRLHYDQGVDLIIVDYLQLIRGSDNRQENRVQEISEISRSLKALARELNVPVIAVSQLSRAVELRNPHVPLLSDLRESGSIEQDADIVVFIYREDVYHSKEEWESRYPPDKPYPKGIADLIVAKHRNGPTGTVNLRFIQKLTKFEDYEEEKDERTLPRFSI